MDGSPDTNGSNPTICNKLNTVTDPADNTRIRHTGILKTLNLVQEKIKLYKSQRKNIGNLCNDIDCIVNNLKRIRKIDDCKELETSFRSDCLIMEDIRKKHEQRLKQTKRNWWEKLDIYDNL